MMQLRKSISTLRMWRLVPAIAVLIGLIGCGGETAATFTAGSGPGGLDGGVISNDGEDYELELADDGSLKSVSISNGDSMEFDGIGEDGVARPSMIVSGEDSLSIDRDTGTFTVAVEAPFGLGRQQFTGNLSDLPIAGINARAINQNGQQTPCETVVSSVDLFCSTFLADEAMSLAATIALAQSLIPDEFKDLASGLVEDRVTAFFDTMGDTCGAWQSLRDGMPNEDPPVPPFDPCS